VSRKLPQDIIRLLIVLIHEAHVLTMLNSTRAQAASQEVLPSRETSPLPRTTSEG
jgi:hypothetical protein